MKIWSVKSFPVKNRLIFFIFLAILDDLVHPGEDIESLLVSSEFSNFTLMSFDITCVLLLSPWCAKASCRDHGNPWYLFAWNFRLNFLVMTTWF